MAQIEDFKIDGGLPRHVAIIMDGNNRWARSRHLPGIAGHKAGVDTVRSTVQLSVELGIEVLTLFAFSSENWKRPSNEVSALMKLFLWVLKREVKKLHRNNIRLRIMGDISAFEPEIQRYIQEAESLTAENDGMTLVVAANYGGQWDIVQASQKIAQKAVEGQLDISQLDVSTFNEYMSLSDYPSPDLCIRTAGEQRISNFMLWQFAYTELYFSEVFWPDFDKAEYHKALSSYGTRQRRFGKTDEQIEAEAMKSSA